MELTAQTAIDNPADCASPSLNSEQSASIARFVHKAWRTNSFSRKIQHDHKGQPVHHEWMFQFIDIIYVATVFNLSHMITECGQDTDVYIMVISIFAIMFNTRQAFDAYSCISGANGVIHLVAFSVYGVGVFLMTSNIFERLQCGESESSDYRYGRCQKSSYYERTFAAGFILTRTILIVMYMIYFLHYHEVNEIGSAPDVGKELRESELKGVARDLRTVYRTDEVVSTASNPVNIFMRPTDVLVPDIKTTLHETNKTTQARHFSNVVWLKVVPAVITIGVMCAVFVKDVSILNVFPVVAGVEVLVDFFVAFVASEQDWKLLTTATEFASERLSLFFMLVVGEGLLGIAAHHASMRKKYWDEANGIIICAYFILFSVGLQFSEHIQVDGRERGRNPLDLLMWRPVYVWLIWLASLFMLLASNGISVVLLSFQAWKRRIKVTCHSEHPEEPEIELSEGKQSLSYGLAAVVCLITVIRIMDTADYRRALWSPVVYIWKRLTCRCDDEEAPQAGNRQALQRDWWNNRIFRVTFLRIFFALYQGSLWGMVNSNHDELVFIAVSFVYTAVPNLVEVVIGLRKAIVKRWQDHAKNSRPSTSVMSA